MRQIVRFPQFLIFLALLTTQSRAFGQMERTIYQTFAIDSATTVTLDLVGFTEIEISAWAGNEILTEVYIQIWDASPEILDYFVEQGRYQFEFIKANNEALISTKVRERKLIKTKLSGPRGCNEISKLKVFVPDNYFWNALLEADSDGRIKVNSDTYLFWESGQNSDAGEESPEDRNKHKLIKTLFIRPE
jgi:hypothetical protein